MEYDKAVVLNNLMVRSIRTALSGLLLFRAVLAAASRTLLFGSLRFAGAPTRTDRRGDIHAGSELPCLFLCVSPAQCSIREAIVVDLGLIKLLGSMRITSGPASYDTELTGSDSQVHQIETEAYGAVLRAFAVQSDVLSWGKEGLITELRKELRVSDVEHREILGRINSEEYIKSLREWRKGNGAQEQMAKSSSCADRTTIFHVSRKKLKPLHIKLCSPNYSHPVQPSPVAISSIVGHVRDDQWGCKGGVLSPKVNVERATIPLSQNRQAPNSGKVRGPIMVQAPRKGSVQPGIENMQLGPGIVEIRATDKLIHEVEKICGENPDPAQLQRATYMLKEHERALLEVIESIPDATDCNDSPGQRLLKYPTEESNYHAGHQQFERARGYYNGGNGPGHEERAAISCIPTQEGEYDWSR